MADPLAELRAFRVRLHATFDRRKDALFELNDAVLAAGTVPAPVHLSLQPVHRRAWTSLYAALRNGSIDVEAARELLADQPPLDNGGRGIAVYVDRSVWPRCDAEASPERGYYHHPSRHSAGQPIVAGWSYQLVAGLGFERDSWITPVDARRVRPEQDANDIAAEQVEALVRRLSEPRPAPLFVFDAGYDPVRLQKGLEGCAAQILVRLHSSRTFYDDPPTLERRPVGKPFVHGKKFDLKNPSTWHQPSAEHRSEEAGYGKVRVRAWSGLASQDPTGERTLRLRERLRSQGNGGSGGGRETPSRRAPTQTQEAMAMVARLRRAGAGVAVKKLRASIRHRTWGEITQKRTGLDHPKG